MMAKILAGTENIGTLGPRKSLGLQTGNTSFSLIFQVVMSSQSPRP
jgi:hypothetical protein